MLKKLTSEIKSHLFLYLLLAVILIAAFVIRIYRVNEILGFYYDQGRDALVIWELWHKGKLFLIGPTTGIAGIFRGPFYYYLIAPFYLMGGGNPVWPSVFLAGTTVAAIFMMYYLGAKIQNRTTGIIAALLGAFSYAIVYASRWLSNPTPMLLLSLLLVWMMFLVSEGRRRAWIVIALILGLSVFHFGSSGEVFYFPAIAIFALWQRKNLPNKKIFIISCATFLLTALPLVIFDLRHGGILSQNIVKFFGGDKSFGGSSWRFASDKVVFYYNGFATKIFHAIYDKEKFILGSLAFFFIYFLSKFLRNPKFKILLLLFISPILGLIFFRGNFGNIYDYYLTGYYLIFLLLVAVTLGHLFKYKLGKIFVIYFLYLFLSSNWFWVSATITDPGTDKSSVAFANQKHAIDWIYQDAKGADFNVDAYVPPVIPYAYDYLFKWYPTTPGLGGASGKLVEERVPLLYTLYEPDNPHPERLDAWLKRQAGIGKVYETAIFGGITVERRMRIGKD